MGKLQDKIAIVTGAASGIGQACAELFAEEGAKEREPEGRVRLASIRLGPLVEILKPVGADAGSISAGEGGQEPEVAGRVRDIFERVE